MRSGAGRFGAALGGGGAMDSVEGVAGLGVGGKDPPVVLGGGLLKVSRKFWAGFMFWVCLIRGGFG